MTTPTKAEALRALSVMDEYASTHPDVINNDSEEATEVQEAYRTLITYLEV